MKTAAAFLIEGVSSNRLFLKISNSWNSFVKHPKAYIENRIIMRFVRLITIYKYLFTWGISDSISKRDGLAFVLIVKNEAPYMKEWLDFHTKQGVSHFIIFNNDSTDNLEEVLAPYISSGKVTYQKIKGLHRQNYSYRLAIKKYKKNFRYMGFIDADEFVFLRKNTSENGNLFEFVDDFMKAHENAGGIAVNWAIFGSSGFEKKPEGGVLKNFVMRAEDDFGVNRHIKTICDPMKVFTLINPHFPLYKRGFYNLYENGEKVPLDPKDWKEIHFNKIRINHYVVKSKEEFLEKRSKGDEAGSIRTMEYFTGHDQNVIKDTEILSRI